ncbi:MAG: hypothetical protein ACJ8MR_10915, partial [Povalibacter sp.]
AAPTCSRESQLNSQLVRLARDQGTQLVQTLDRIQGTGRQLLALRSYLRSRDSLADRWSWSQMQIDEFRRSREYHDLVTEVAKIRARFEADNPGFELYANTEVRSLDLQIQRWNENQSVARLANSLESTLCQRFDSKDAGELTPDVLREALIHWQPSTPAPLAAPGLSLHGRARAIDFQIHQGTRVIAGPEVAKIRSTWEAQGWSKKLSSAVSAASDKFKGPLKAPNEPWHYEYRPAPAQ